MPPPLEIPSFASAHTVSRLQIDQQTDAAASRYFLSGSGFLLSQPIQPPKAVPLYRAGFEVPTILGATSAQRRAIGRWSFSLFLTPFPNRLPVRVDVAKAMDQPVVALQRAEIHEFSSCCNPHTCDFGNCEMPHRFFSLPQHTAKHIFGTEGDERMHRRGRLTPMGSPCFDVGRADPHSGERGSKLYRLACQHCSAGVHPLDLFVGAHR